MRQVFCSWVYPSGKTVNGEEAADARQVITQLAAVRHLLQASFAGSAVGLSNSSATGGPQPHSCEQQVQLQTSASMIRAGNTLPSVSVGVASTKVAVVAFSSDSCSSPSG
jgi:hypothetical protein